MTASAAQGLEALQPTHHGSWEPRRALTLNAARRRTALVSLMRMIFAGGAIAITLLVIAQMFFGSQGGATESTEAVSTDVRMLNPRFTGRDENLTPYTVTADSAIRRSDSAIGLTDLDRPRLEYDLLTGGGAESLVLAEAGVYDPSNRIIDLTTEVNFNTAEGYSFATDHARVYLREERVVGEEPVDGNGPMGQIRADRFEILDGGDRVIFEGRVRARIVQDRTDTATDGDGN
ncbi:MAG: LPS export ABC transporter periplasmic protein LptC [Pseudomonadota bacterium]|nr:LPS export ABC transporter periplasmic protein LptC [Pseudomonadota bacterium]